MSFSLCASPAEALTMALQLEFSCKIAPRQSAGRKFPAARCCKWLSAAVSLPCCYAHSNWYSWSNRLPPVETRFSPADIAFRRAVAQTGCGVFQTAEGFCSNTAPPPRRMKAPDLNRRLAPPERRISRFKRLASAAVFTSQLSPFPAFCSTQKPPASGDTGPGTRISLWTSSRLAAVFPQRPLKRRAANRCNIAASGNYSCGFAAAADCTFGSTAPVRQTSARSTW